MTNLLGNLLGFHLLWVSIKAQALTLSQDFAVKEDKAIHQRIITLTAIAFIIGMIIIGMLCLIRPKRIYSHYRGNFLGKPDGLSINVKNQPKWLPESPTAEAIILIRLIGIFTIVFMLIILEPFFIRIYFFITRGG